MSGTPQKIVVGVLVSERIVAGLVADGRMDDGIQHYPAPEDSDAALTSMPADDVVSVICAQIRTLCHARGIEVASLSGIGVGFPGIIKDGVVEESPNLQQMKGRVLAASFRGNLEIHSGPVVISNDADALAAGIAAIHGHLGKVVRVWTLGRGVGFGTHPAATGVWEGGHMVVTLDPKERFCGCGGVGHIEGIMGTGAMRKRFLDMEPDEVFLNAKSGDERCIRFVRLWHRALAAGTANSVHLSGPGRFYITGPNARFVDIELLSRYVYEMVKMSPLQGTVFEITPVDDRTAIIGAAVNALS